MPRPGVGSTLVYARHLVGRFFSSLTRSKPTAEQERWALEHLLDCERGLWQRMSPADRRHAIDVAKEALRLLDEAEMPPRREVLAAALLHDVGKIESGLGTIARVGITVGVAVLGRERVLSAADGGADRPRLLSMARRYLAHDRLGAGLLREAGSDPFTVAWAEQHHLDPDRWTIDRRVGELLKAADDS